MGKYLDDLWNDLEQTWDLAMKVNDLPEQERSDVSGAWETYFKPAELVDAARTEGEGVTPPTKVFCVNIYGLQYNPETKYWVPFRHGDIDLAKFTED
ncbi:hypothetical protein [Nisaea sp.]|uniref:hypothetical protein n=1 Tax=Nisaea sp. TaxID=2024842 RepID=UPI00329A2370